MATEIQNGATVQKIGLQKPRVRCGTGIKINLFSLTKRGVSRQILRLYRRFVVETIRLNAAEIHQPHFLRPFHTPSASVFVLSAASL